MNMLPLILAAAATLAAESEKASDFVGPGRFCGYSAIIDLEPGEKVEPLGYGIHGGEFRLTGSFGSLEVGESGWARKPSGRVKALTALKLTMFHQHRQESRWMIALWNGEHGVARFVADTRFTTEQLKVIERVRLINEGDEPDGCKYRVIFTVE